MPNPVQGQTARGIFQQSVLNSKEIVGTSIEQTSDNLFNKIVATSPPPSSGSDGDEYTLDIPSLLKGKISTDIDSKSLFKLAGRGSGPQGIKQKLQYGTAKTTHYVAIGILIATGVVALFLCGPIVFWIVLAVGALLHTASKHISKKSSIACIRNRAIMEAQIIRKKHADKAPEKDRPLFLSIAPTDLDSAALLDSE